MKITVLEGFFLYNWAILLKSLRKGRPNKGMHLRKNCIFILILTISTFPLFFSVGNNVIYKIFTNVPIGAALYDADTLSLMLLAIEPCIQNIRYSGPNSKSSYYDILSPTELSAKCLLGLWKQHWRKKHNKSFLICEYRTEQRWSYSQIKLHLD